MNILLLFINGVTAFVFHPCITLTWPQSKFRFDWVQYVYVWIVWFGSSEIFILFSWCFLGNATYGFQVKLQKPEWSAYDTFCTFTVQGWSGNKCKVWLFSCDVTFIIIIWYYNFMLLLKCTKLIHSNLLVLVNLL